MFTETLIFGSQQVLSFLGHALLLDKRPQEFTVAVTPQHCQTVFFLMHLYLSP